MCSISNRGWGCLRDLSSKGNDEIPIGNVVKILDNRDIDWALLESICWIDLFMGHPSVILGYPGVILGDPVVILGDPVVILG